MKIKITHSRSILKAIVWRIIAFIITTSIVFVITGEIVLAAEIGIAESLVKILVYYLYERAWLKINWGIING